MPAKKTYPFEKSLEQLEQLVEQMEAGDLSLEESLNTFEKGIKLTRECVQALAQAEQRIKLLVEKNGEIKEEDFSNSSNNNNNNNNSDSSNTSDTSDSSDNSDTSSEQP